jgi:ubiquinone biosynthesis protein COQ9
MTEDTSEGFTNTVEFVERRLRDADSFVETIGDVKKYLGYVAGSVVAAGRSFGMKV